MSLEAGQYIGLVKFFREISHLEMFLDGKLYCNTPEYYRLADAPGISDRNESCHISLRAVRNDPEWEMEVSGESVGKVSNFIIRSGRADGWIQCWTVLNFPKDDQTFDTLIDNFKKLKQEFGPYYIFVNPENSHKMIDRIKYSLGVDLQAKQVEYEDYPILGDSIYKKTLNFSYQNEFRIVFGECKTDDVEPKIFSISKGFRDIIETNPKIELTAKSNERDFRFILEHV
ncbi:putative uncharacterized phage protein [Moritella viscosa]|nr:hypothetical protein [Moritella viscosa]CED59837.1 putative uncharacterized phage protein [Moritella viscosa]SHO03516.1 Putative uncharacterized protein [Moritella viscosa]